MALELVGGAALGVLFDQLLKEIWRVKDNFVKFRPKLKELEETLTVLYPAIREIEELNRRLNSQNHEGETTNLRRLLEDGTNLVSECSKIARWNIFKKRCYRGKLMKLDNKILRFHNLYMQAHMGRDQKQTLLFVQETRQMIMSLNQHGFSNLTEPINQHGFSNLTMPITASSSTDSSDLTPASSTGSSNITVGITASSTGSFSRVYKSGSVVRALDITKFRSYIELRSELDWMYGLEGKLEDPISSGWQLVFVDHEHEVLHLGGGPWLQFVNSVWRIFILSPQEVQQVGSFFNIIALN